MENCQAHLPAGGGSEKGVELSRSMTRDVQSWFPNWEKTTMKQSFTESFLLIDFKSKISLGE